MAYCILIFLKKGPEKGPKKGPKKGPDMPEKLQKYENCEINFTEK